MKISNTNRNQFYELSLLKQDFEMIEVNTTRGSKSGNVTHDNSKVEGGKNFPSNKNGNSEFNQPSGKPQKDNQSPRRVIFQVSQPPYNIWNINLLLHINTKRKGNTQLVSNLWVNDETLIHN